MKTIKIKSHLAELDNIRSFLKSSIEGFDISDKDYFKIELSLLEVCVNIIRYAYPKNEGEILLKIWQQEDKIFIEIRDEGIPFDPTNLEKPDIHEVIQNEKKGGFGVFLSRELMDGFDYKRENNKNVLTVYKII